MLSLSALVILCLVFVWGCSHILNKNELKNEKVTAYTEYEKNIIRDRIINLNGKDNEAFNSKILEHLGYKTVLMPLDTTNGKDIIVSNNGEKLFVECSHTNDNNMVGKADAQKLCGSMAVNNISKGIIFTLNGSNKNCKNYCNKIKGKTIKIDSIEVLDLLNLLENCSEETSDEIFKILSLNRADFINYNNINK